MTDRDRERVGGVVRRRWSVEVQDRLHHPLHLGFLGPPVGADRLFHAGRRILSALDPGERRRDEDRAARLADLERGAGVDADE